MVIKYILSGIPYNLSDVPLGSLVSKKSQPNQDAYIPLHDLKQPDDFDWRNQENFAFTFDKRNEASLNAWLTRFADFRAASATEAHDQLWSKEGRIYELRQPINLFNSLCGEQSAREWLEQRYTSGESVHMVVGYRTFRDSKSIQEDEKSFEGSLEGTVPAGQIAAGGAPVDAGALEVKMKARALRWRRTAQSFCIKGERIFAICFRRVRYNWFARGDVDQSHLDGKNQWIVALRFKGKDASKVMEVVLENEDDIEDSDEASVDDLDEMDDKPEASVAPVKEERLPAMKDVDESEVEFYL